MLNIMLPVRREIFKPEISTEINDKGLAVKEAFRLFCGGPMRKTKKVYIAGAAMVPIRGLQHSVEIPCQ
jgi:hypothetical protein